MKIKSKNVYLEEKFQEASIEFVDGKIVNIVKSNDDHVDVDYGSLRILPGFIDIHCHGYDMMSINYVHKQGLIKWMMQLPHEGVTSFLPSSSTAPKHNLLESFKIISEVKETETKGAQILGINVEGPQISFTHNGAQNPYDILKPGIDEFNEFQEAAQGNIKLITIAPEMDDNHKLIKYCASQGIRVSIGHTGASFEETASAIEDGASSFTHTFNGMTQMGHRAPGVAGAALIFDETYAELICDGIHVHPGVGKVLAKCKSKDKLIFVSDSVQIKGLKPGVYESFGRTLTVRDDGSVHLKDGKLAGSTNCMNELLKTAIEVMKIDEVTAFNAATINPATFLGCKEKGILKEGCDADIVILNDDYSVYAVYVRGEEFTS